MFGNKTFKKLGYKKIKIKGSEFVIKKLTPLDFLDDEGIPFTIFSVDNPRTLYGEVWGKVKTDDEIDRDETNKMKLIRQVLNKGVVRFPIDTATNDFLQPDTLELGIELYGRVIAYTLMAFLRPIVVIKKQLLFWDTLGKRYGKLPIDCLMPHGGYSDTDAFIFNSLVLGEAIKEENRIAKKNKARLK